MGAQSQRKRLLTRCEHIRLQWQLPSLVESRTMIGVPLRRNPARHQKGHLSFFAACQENGMWVFADEDVEESASAANLSMHRDS